MRGGIVAVGVVFIVLGVAWFLPVMFGSAFGIGGALAGLCLWIIFAPILLILGIVLFIVGLVAESPRPAVYLPYYPPPPPPP